MNKTFTITLTYIVRAIDSKAAIQEVMQYHRDEANAIQQDTLVQANGPWTVNQAGVLVLEITPA